VYRKHTIAFKKNYVVVYYRLHNSFLLKKYFFINNLFFIKYIFD